jgi:hypothetical protein
LGTSKGNLRELWETSNGNLGNLGTSNGNILEHLMETWGTSSWEPLLVMGTFRSLKERLGTFGNQIFYIPNKVSGGSDERFCSLLEKFTLPQWSLHCGSAVCLSWQHHEMPSPGGWLGTCLGGPHKSHSDHPE